MPALVSKAKQLRKGKFKNQVLFPLRIFIYNFLFYHFIIFTYISGNSSMKTYFF